MKTKHTPAPWNIFRQDDDMIIEPYSLSKRNYAIASITGGNGIEEDEANAKLIAAAPELLEALEAMKDYCKYHKIPLGSGIVHKVDEAIKKATL